MFNISILNLSDYRKILECKTTPKAPKNYDIYYPSTNSEIKRALRDCKDSFVIGAKCYNKIIAYLLVEKQKKYYDNTFPNDDNILIIQDVFVNINYRGLKLQKKLFQYVFDFCNTNNYEVWCCVSPLNKISLNNIKQLNMKLYGNVKAYSNYERLVFYRKFPPNNL